MNIIDLGVISNKKIKDEDIYKYYGITKEEQQLIEEVVNEQPETKKIKKN